MTTFQNATTADFDRYAENSFARDLDRYLSAQDESERHAERMADEQDERDLAAHDEAVSERYVSEADYNAATPEEWAGLALVLDMEQHSFTL